MASQGSPGARLQRAIGTGNLNLVRAAAAELPIVPLGDAARIVALIAEHEPQSFEVAALRWIARLIAERPAVSLEDVAAAAHAFEQIGRAPELGVDRLRALL